MPLNTRGKIRRCVRYAGQDVIAAHGLLSREGARFENVRPDLYKVFQAALTLLNRSLVHIHVLDSRI